MGHKLLVFSIVLILIVFLIMVVGYFGVYSPGGGCTSFGLQIFAKDLQKIYEESDVFDCGYIEPWVGNETYTFECLQDALEHCTLAKALVKVQGFERVFLTHYEITEDCKIKISAGGCGTYTLTCDNLVHYEDVHSQRFKELC